MRPADFLRRYPLFALLGNRRLDAWVAAGQELAAATGETLLQAGTTGTWAYLLREGRVRVLQPSARGGDVTLGVLRPGELFGEYALLPPHQNTATCRAAAPCRLLQLPLLPLRSALERLPAVRGNLKNWLRLHVLLGYLRDAAFLGFMAADSSLPLLDRCEERAFAAGQTIQADGLSGERWFYVRSGEVDLRAAEGGPGPGLRLGPGDCFGERGLLGRAGLPTAVARTEVRCLSLARGAFEPAGEGHTASVQTAVPERNRPARADVWVGQQEAADCGVAALAMVARHHGLAVSVEQLRARVPLGERGASLQDLQRAAAGPGLRGRAVQVGPDQLGEVRLPALAHLRGGHYVVVFGVGPQGVEVGDPAAGLVTLSLTGFCGECSGALLLLDPGSPGPGGVRGRTAG